MASQIEKTETIDAVVPRPISCAHPPEKLNVLHQAKDYITGDSFEIRRCANCGLAMTAPAPPPENMDRYYPAEYFRRSGGRRFPAPVEMLQRALYASRARSVERVKGNGPGKVLDIGCGPGWLLRAFKARGWEAHGTEMTEESAAFARDTLNIPMSVGDLASIKFPDNHFDAVAMWHVLEHVTDPPAVIAEVRRILKPGGVFFVGVPNHSSPEAKLGRGGWFHLDVPRHLSHMGGGLQREMLKDNGLEVRRATWLAPEYDCFSFVQTALNRLGFRHNLLYNLLRRGGAKVIREDRVGILQTALMLLLAAPLGLLSVIATPILALIRQGATVTFHAVKANEDTPRA